MMSEERAFTVSSFYNFIGEHFQSLVPYIVGIVEFNMGIRFPGMIRDVDPKEIEVGMNLKIGFDGPSSSQWPPWNRYFFRPLNIP
jgi:uncharacterized OB-fold protein